MDDTYHIATLPNAPKKAVGCIDLVESDDDGGWYAHQYDFRRADNATRTSRKIYRTRSELVRALDTGKHLWKAWS
jgi:hypothetical protein